MAVRTDATLVKANLAPGGDYNLRTNPSLTPAITKANLVVNRVATCASDRGLPLTEEELTVLETELASHFYCMSDQTFASKSTEGASASFHGQTGMSLDATKYGQNAKLLDPSGCLSSMQSRVRATAAWLGKKRSEQIDYQDRD